MKKKIILIILFILILVFLPACSSTETEHISSGQGAESGQQSVTEQETSSEQKSPPEQESVSNQTSTRGQGSMIEEEAGESPPSSNAASDKSPGQETPQKPIGQNHDQNSIQCTFSINCSTVFDNLDKIDSQLVEILPADGWIYPPKKIRFTETESIFDILLRITKQEKIHMESNSNPVLKSKYVEGIHNLYEFDAGELSGWTYKVNGKGMGYGSSSSYPKDGDAIEWVYTCDQGRDVGVSP